MLRNKFPLVQICSNEPRWSLLEPWRYVHIKKSILNPFEQSGAKQWSIHSEVHQTSSFYITHFLKVPFFPDICYITNSHWCRFVQMSPGGVCLSHGGMFT